MTILALATSGPRAAVGLRTDDGKVEVLALGDGAERGKGVAPAVDELLRRKGLTPKALTGVAVDLGPGSFTGVRVGVATAKALAMALEIPVVGVVSLEALVVAAGPAGATVLALRDARAGEAYFGLWKGIDEAPEPGAPLATPLHRLMKPTRGRAVDVMTALSERGIERVLAVGEDAERLAVTLPLQGCLAGVRTPDAGPEAVLSLALPRFAAGTVDDADALAPRYLQPSTPELRLQKGERRLGGEAV